MGFKELALKLMIVCIFINAIYYTTAPSMGLPTPGKSIFNFMDQEVWEQTRYGSTNQKSEYDISPETEESTITILDLIASPIVFASKLYSLVLGYWQLLDNSLTGWFIIFTNAGVPNGAFFIIMVLIKLIIYIGLGLYFLDLVAAIAGVLP
jgi:hypothetical protein